MRNPFKQFYRKYCLWQYHKRRQSIKFGHDAHKFAWEQEEKWKTEHRPTHA